MLIQYDYNTHFIIILDLFFFNFTDLQNLQLLQICNYLKEKNK